MKQSENVFRTHVRHSTAIEDGSIIEWWEQIMVLRISVGKYPRLEEVVGDLAGIKEAIGGEASVIFPFDDPVALVVSAEGKRIGLHPNRVLRDNDGKIFDIIAGDFLVVGFRDEKIGSLSLTMMDKYTSIFRWPEVFLCHNDGTIHVHQVWDETFAGDTYITL